MSGAGLEIRNLCCRAGRTAILQGISLTAPAGQVTGLIGPNGAGKSTLLLAAAALTPRRALTGEIRFSGTDLAALPPRTRARRLALVEQSADTAERLSAREVVSLGRIPHGALWQQGESAADREAIDRALELTGMAGFAGRSYAGLSGGERQRLQIARALAQEPGLLLLDEPTSHLDIRGQLELMALLARLASAGTTVLVVLHDLPLAARHCDRLAVLCAGTLVAEGSPGDVLTAALLREVWGVDACVTGSAPPEIRFLGPAGPGGGDLR